MGSVGHSLSLDTLAVYIATGVGMTLVALGVVFGGFFAERRLRDRLEDLDGRSRSGSRTIELATLRRAERAGRLASFDKLLWRLFPNASSIRRKLLAAGVKFSLGEFAFGCLAIAVAAWFLFSVVLAMPPLVALAAALALGLGVPNVILGRRVRRRAQKFNLLFPEAVDLIVRALRAGLPVQEAIGNVARDIKDPVGSTFRQAQQEMQLGVPIETALWRAAQAIQTDEFNFLIVAMSIQRDTGGNLAETLANLSALLRARQQLRLKIRAFTSEARATMLIMAGLPFLVGGGLFLITPGYISPLVNTSTGLMVTAGAGCSMALGIFIMNKIATIKV
ncbi:tight adherence protein B [Enhydrobacter aerosaccus]|uniref:Tight adherence protein B n=1 Tax=Enhydrobacter aerosaccus TaxID=225324 RepID=A0A1T4T9B9_9HYPH|nr:type II secretion system F family protein [Enhydrobacter aerosaccus]SKA36967.1 tight adherence protein B [Enhydrobacter aerosaccus]